MSGGDLAKSLLSPRHLFGIIRRLIDDNQAAGVCAPRNDKQNQGHIMKTIITVVGNDRPGIIAGITGALYAMNINILDLSQTIMDSYFTMTMLVDHTNATKSFDEAKECVVEAGKSLGMKVRMQRVDIFDAMHKL